MLKKTLSSSIAIMLVIILLVGCSSGAGTNNPSNTGTNQPTSNAGNNSSKGNDKVETIRVHTWYNLENEKFDVIKEEFEKTHPNIKIEYVSAGDNNSQEHLKKVDLAAASGEEMDVIMFSSIAHYTQRLALGMLEPLDDYLAKEGINYDDEYNVNTKIDGKYYGLPGKAVSFFTLLNADHLAEANLPVPTEWTWDEFLDYAAKLTKLDGEKKRYGTFFHTWTNPYAMLTYANKKDNAYIVTDDHQSANIDTTEMRMALDLRRKADKEKIATPYAEVISQKLNYRPQYFNEEASMILSGTFLIAEVGGTDKVPATFKTVFAPLPKNSKDDPNGVEVTSDLVSIYSKSKHKDAAYTFARWFTTEGLVLQGRNIPSWKNADMKQVLDTIVDATANPEMVDKESLLNFFENTPSITRPAPPAYTAEVEEGLQVEFDRFMLEDQSVEDTISKAQEKIQKIVDSNK